MEGQKGSLDRSEKDSWSKVAEVATVKRVVQNGDEKGSSEPILNERVLSSIITLVKK